MKMSDEDLLRVLEAEEDDAHDGSDGQIAADRVRSMRDYHRMRYGTEVDGRSQVVSSDVFDAVEGMLPDLLDVFVASDRAVVFDPVGPEDEEAAEQVTNACNHVFYKQNNGFLLLYTAAKDALLLKTGALKWWWEVKRTPSFTTHKGVVEDALAQYLQENPEAEVVSKEEFVPSEEEKAQDEEAYAEAAQKAQAMGLPLPPRPEQIPRYTVKIKLVEERGQVRIAAVPADEVSIARRHNSILLDECPYVAHSCERTLSDIREMGFDISIEDLKAAMAQRTSGDRKYRDTLANRNDIQAGSEDEAMLKAWLREEYVLCDYDGDGIAERRKIIRLGSKILENVETSHVQMAAWTPYILQHQFNGLSVADLVTDFQRIGTEIWRAQLDNLDLANNQETVVLTDAHGNPLAELDDIFNRRSGGVMRESVPNAIRPYAQRWQGVEAMPMIEMLQSAKENRTGWTRYSQGLDADSLNKTATGVNAIMNASQKRMKLMARVMAECLVAPMFRGVFKTLQDYCMEKLSFRLSGQFVSYDPQNWRDAYDMTINVGIGTGDVAQQSAYLGQIAQAQFAVLQTPFGGRIVNEKNFYAVQRRIAENAGFKNPNEFWSDPAQLEPAQPQPSPDMLKAQASMAALQFSAQQDAHKFQAQQASDQQKFQAETALEREKMAMQAQVDQNREEMQARQKQLEAQQQAQLDQLKAAHDMQQAAAMLEFERWKAELDASVKLQIAGMSAAPPPDNRLDAVIEALGQVAEQMAAPSEIVRDPVTQRAIGVKRGARVQRVVRDSNGRAQGLQ